MNILIINTGDISAASSGGVNRVSYVLSRKFKETYNIGCFLGFFDENPAKPVAEMDGRIKLSNPLNKTQFEEFLRSNRIDLVQINFLRKRNVKVIPEMYRIARRNGVRVISCFHMCPGFEQVTYGTLSQVKYALKNRKNLPGEIRNMLITILQPVLKPFVACLLKPKYRAQYDNSDTVVVLSKNYIRPYLALAGAKDEKKIHAISNALTFNEFISDEEILKKQKEVLIVARLEEHTKRLSLALKIWKGIEKINTLNDWRLTIVGDGKDEGYYKHLCEKFKLERCKFEGRQNPLAYYKQASVFMMTSAAEGWPMTLMESIQMGVVPVVFDSFGSLHDIVTDGENGLIVPEKHISEYVAALSKLMSNNELRQKMAMNAVESSKRFTVENVTKQWIELFNRLLDF